MAQRIGAPRCALAACDGRGGVLLVRVESARQTAAGALGAGGSFSGDAGSIDRERETGHGRFWGRERALPRAGVLYGSGRG